jgi:hypothetical protein
MRWVEPATTAASCTRTAPDAPNVRVATGCEVSPIINRDDLPATPDWAFTPVESEPGPSLVMPRLWQDNADQA